MLFGGLTMKKFSKQRIAILVDAENLEICAHNYFSQRVDYKELIDAIDDREIVRAIYYTKKEKVKTMDYADQDKLNTFLDFLKHSLGFEIKTSSKNADSLLTVDAICISTKVDVIVLVGGDSDYLPLISYLRTRGVKTEVWMFEEATSNRLRETVDEFMPLGKSFLRTF